MSPLAGYTCPPGTPTVGMHNHIDHCLGACAHPCVAAPLLAAMWNAEHSNHHVGPYISASMLAGSGCERQTWLERYHDFYETPRRRFWPFRGTICHALVEGAGSLVERFGYLQELRMAVPLHYRDLPAPIFDDEGAFTGEYDSTRHLVLTLGGTTDVTNPYLRLVQDMKTLSDLKIEGFLNKEEGGALHPQIKDSWIWQTNIYAWMLARTEIPDDVRARLRGHGLPELGTYYPKPERLQIQLVSMMELPLTGEAYVPLKHKGMPYEIEEVPVLPDEQVETFVRESALRWYRYLVLKEQPPLVAPSLKWMCYNCQFNTAKVGAAGRCDPVGERAELKRRVAEANRPKPVYAGGYEDAA